MAFAVFRSPLRRAVPARSRSSDMDAPSGIAPAAAFLSPVAASPLAGGAAPCLPVAPVGAVAVVTAIAVVAVGAADVCAVAVGVVVFAAVSVAVAAIVAAVAGGCV